MFIQVVISFSCNVKRFSLQVLQIFLPTLKSSKNGDFNILFLFLAFLKENSKGSEVTVSNI
jgi:hypothetical protein